MLIKAIIIAALAGISLVIAKTPKSTQKHWAKKLGKVGISLIVGIGVFTITKKASLAVPAAALALYLSHCITSKRPTAFQGMKIEEALQIFDLSEPPKDKATIIKRHRSLMRKHHPDKGGNNDDAAKINRAKEVLLKTIDEGDD